MIAQAFMPPAIRLPAPALSRRWLADEIRNKNAGYFFKRLLRRFSPQAFAQCKERTWKGYYRALLAALQPVLPLGWMADDWADSVEDARELIEWGIPVNVLGVWAEALCEGESPAYSMSAMMAGAWDIEFEHLFEAYPDLLDRANRNHVQEFHKGKIRLPRGYQWIEPWQATADLYLYTIGQTGNAFLDYCDEEETMHPAWSLGEINALIREWKLAEPRYDAILALRAHIDDTPAMVERRLHTLISVLAGNWDDVIEVAITPKESNRGKAITQRSLR